MRHNQRGQGLPVFEGTRLQRGRGLGSILGGFARAAVPILKTTAKKGTEEALRAGYNVLRDISRGQSLKNALKRRATEALKNTAKRTVQRIQTGQGRKRGIKRKQKDLNFRPRLTKKRRASPRSDIFGHY